MSGRPPHEGTSRSGESSDAPASWAPQGRSRSRAQRGRTPDSGSGGRQFLFIDASTDRNTVGEAVRVHVMREAHRTRRERRGSQTRGRRTTAQDEMVILDFRAGSGQPSPSPPRPTVPEQDISTRPSSPSTIDWPAVIQLGTSDFTLESIQALHHLAEGYWRHMRAVQPDVLHLCHGDFLCLCAYLALASLQLASDEADQANVASVQFEARALELLRLRITQTTRMHTDATLVAVLLLSRLEEYKDNREAALFHQNALQRLVHDRGGLSQIESQNAELGQLLSQCGLLGEIAP